MQPARKPYPSNVSDEEWAFVAPYLRLLPEDAVQRRHELREVFNALKRLVRAGAPWRLLPHDSPSWPPIVCRQARRRHEAGVFEAMVHDLRVLLRDLAGREARPPAAVLDSRTLRSTPEGGHRAGDDGAKRRRGAKLHAAVDTLGHLLAAHVTPAGAQDRAQVERLAAAVQAATGEGIGIAYVDQGYTPGASRPPPRRTVSGPTSSSTPGPSAAPCCRRGAGWPSGASPGRRALPPPRQGLRAPARNPGRPARPRLRLPYGA